MQAAGEDGPRIVVIGMSGAGKSTLARGLAAALGVPHVELDALFWGPGWEPHPPSQFRAAVREAAAGPAWVADGNYSSVREILWPRATAIVWLNLPFFTVFGRVFRRTLRRVFLRERLWQDNRESLARTFFSRESILWWVIRNHGRRRREMEALRASGRYGQARWIELRQLRSPAEVLAMMRSAEA